LDQTLYFLLPIIWRLAKQCHFGACGFFGNPLDIVNRIIFHYLISKSSKRIFIKINLWAQESPLEGCLNKYSLCKPNCVQMMIYNINALCFYNVNNNLSFENMNSTSKFFNLEKLVKQGQWHT